MRCEQIYGTGQGDTVTKMTARLISPEEEGKKKKNYPLS
jgi:hypothetical protein